MKLAAFLQDLLERGEVTVAGRVVPFEEADLHESEILLKHYYEEDLLEMPGVAPEFSAEAALWAAQYLYRAVQLAVIRDLGEEVVEEHLRAFLGEITPQAVYSVDLTFRYLPDLLRLTKGLAPDDILVAKLRQAARQWPFSTVGVVLAGELSHGSILSHPSLKIAYVDRIIKKKDKDRAAYEGIAEHIQGALGQYASVLWPEFTY